MAFVPGFEHDIFVSYARADDAVEGWVSQIVKSLDVELRRRLGGATELKFFLDAQNLNANCQLKELLEAANGSALFLAVASRSYAERDWTKEELKTFVDTAVDTHRLFAIECLPLDPGKKYDDPLQKHNRMRFWRNVAPSDTPMPLSPKLKVTKNLLQNLAEQMRNELLAMKGKATGSNGTEVTTIAGTDDKKKHRSVPATEYRRVLLSQVTEELDEQNEQLRSFLEQFGVAVFPADSYPQGGEAFKAAFQSDLAEADLFVQLLGPHKGRTPHDLAEGYTQFQYAAAQTRGTEIVQWRRPDLDPKSVEKQDHRELLMADTIMAMGFQSFKNEVLKRAAKPNATPSKASPSSLVFINARQEDTEIANTLRGEFSKHKFPSILMTSTGNTSDNRAKLDENIVDCDALIVVYGQASSDWVESVWKHYFKVKYKRRGRGDPRVLAQYIGPPPEKDPLMIHVPDLHEIDCRNGVAMELLSPIIEELER